MKIIIIGASGVIGRQVTAALEKEHEVIRVGSKSGDILADIGMPDSIRRMYEQAGNFDALICASGNAHFGPLKEMTDKEFRIGIESKLMGQVNLVLMGQHYINHKGSFTLTSGILSEQPILLGANPATTNGAIESFVRSAAVELENGVRINAVSPNVVEDSPQYFPYFPGQIPVTMKQVVYGYLRSVLGAGTGQVIKVY
ncbi:short chain dehydrogenase [Taibaiella koreensis]|uniref:short chain dehydrogenase n=1 Tax=Taibaiella koreensis TaxID=1268548 RepID=UPI000E59FC5C|nr:short chain dehydrogenase [Taibaiella koreensis]